VTLSPNARKRGETHGAANFGQKRCAGHDSVADELTCLGEKLRPLAEAMNGQEDRSSLCLQVSDRLLQLSADLKGREEADAEMRENYPYFKEIVEKLLQQHIDRELPPLPEGKDLETIAAEEGALPLESFWPELFQVKEDLSDVR
jgi:hypothetical protein